MAQGRQNTTSRAKSPRAKAQVIRQPRMCKGEGPSTKGQRPIQGCISKGGGPNTRKGDEPSVKFLSYCRAKAIP